MAISASAMTMLAMLVEQVHPALQPGGAGGDGDDGVRQAPAACRARAGGASRERAAQDEFSGQRGRVASFEEVHAEGARADLGYEARRQPRRRASRAAPPPLRLARLARQRGRGPPGPAASKRARSASSSRSTPPARRASAQHRRRGRPVRPPGLPTSLAYRSPSGRKRLGRERACPAAARSCGPGGRAAPRPAAAPAGAAPPRQRAPRSAPAPAPFARRDSRSGPAPHPRQPRQPRARSPSSRAAEPRLGRAVVEQRDAPGAPVGERLPRHGAHHLPHPPRRASSTALIARASRMRGQLARHQVRVLVPQVRERAAAPRPRAPARGPRWAVLREVVAARQHAPVGARRSASRPQKTTDPSTPTRLATTT